MNLVNVAAINSFQSLNRKIASFNVERKVVNLKEFTNLTVKAHRDFMTKGERIEKNKHKHGQPSENYKKFNRLVKKLVNNLDAFDPLLLSNNKIYNRL